MKHLLNAPGCALFFCVSALVAGCGDTEAVTPQDPGAGRVTIEVAPLSLDGVTDASYTIRVTNAANGGGEVIWERTAVTSDQFGDGAGSLSYVGPCDADAGTNAVTLTLDALYEGNGVLVAEGTYENPGALIRNVECVENVDVSVVFDITIVREAQQGFFDVAVNFEDIFCSAKLDCVKSGTANDDLELLHNPASGARDLTAVLGFACTAPAAAGATTFLYMDDPVIHCDGGVEPFASANVTFEIVGLGNVPLTAPTSSNPGSYLFGAAVYFGNEALLSKSYWNIAFGLNSETFALANTGDCVLTMRATASATAFAESAEGFALPEGEVYPVIDWNVILTNDTVGRVCTTHEVNGGNGVQTDYLGYLASPNQFTWSAGPVYLKNEYNSGTGVARTAGSGNDRQARTDITIIYVDKTGDDSLGDGTESAPYLSLSKAVTEASEGDYVKLGDGEFDIDGNITYLYDLCTLKNLTFVGNDGDTTIAVRNMLGNYGGSGSAGPIEQGSSAAFYNLIIKTYVEDVSSGFWYNTDPFVNYRFELTFRNVAFTVDNGAYTYQRVFLFANTTVGPKPLYVTFDNCVFDVALSYTVAFGYGSTTPFTNCAKTAAPSYGYGGVVATSLHGVTVDGALNITSGGWEDAGTGLDPDGSQANIGVYGGEFQWGGPNSVIYE